jgi:hypothetical protein
LMVVVAAFPVGVTVVLLLLTGGNFSWLLGGDNFVWLPGIGTFPTGSVFFSTVVAVWLAGMLVWLIIFVACLPTGVTVVWLLLVEEEEEDDGLVWFDYAKAAVESPIETLNANMRPKAGVRTITKDVILLINYQSA